MAESAVIAANTNTITSAPKSVRVMESNPETALSSKLFSEPARANVKKKRAYHTKDRHGCKTCKIRKVRCDKLKPACNRCVTTGRKCDGYDTTPTFALPGPQGLASAPTLPPPVTVSSTPAVQWPSSSLSARSWRELRGFHYFMEAIAPVLGGVFVADFWMMEIPRTCHRDNAVWHAVISLASAHECLVSNGPEVATSRAHTLSHYNLSVQDLLRSYSAEGSWRTLTLSIMFTSICCMESKYAEAQMHTKSACKLLREIDSEASSRAALGNSRPQLTPVSMASLRFMLSALDMKDRQLDRAKEVTVS